jgi:hypothetical protein
MVAFFAINILTIGQGKISLSIFLKFDNFIIKHSI